MSPALRPASSSAARSSTPPPASSISAPASPPTPTRSSRSARSRRCGRPRSSCSSSTRVCSISTFRSVPTSPISRSRMSRPRPRSRPVSCSPTRPASRATSSPTPAAATTASRSTSPRSPTPRSSSRRGATGRTTTRASSRSAGSSRCSAARRGTGAHRAPPPAARSHPRGARPYEAISYKVAQGHIPTGEDGAPRPAPFWALVRSNSPAGSSLSMRVSDLFASRSSTSTAASRPTAPGCSPWTRSRRCSSATSTFQHGPARRGLGARLGDRRHPGRPDGLARRLHGRPVRLPPRHPRARDRGRAAHERR